jgi:hypothetical protein
MRQDHLAALHPVKSEVPGDNGGAT